LYGKQHLLKLRADITKLMMGTTGINKEHFQSLLIEINKIVTKINKTTV
jgi:hypothetical protein